MKVSTFWGLVILTGFFSGCSHLPIAASPNDVLSPAEHVTLGESYLKQNDKRLAKRQFEAALQADRSYVPALVALGNLSFEEKDYKRARRYFERAQKISPKDPAVVNNVAMVYLAEGKNLKGIDVMVEDALDGAGPTTPYLWDTLANIAIRQKRWDDAKNAIEKAAETAPAQDPAFQTQLQETRQKLASAAGTKTAESP